MTRKIILILLCALTLSLTAGAQTSNREMRINYVLKNLNLPKDKQKKLRPLLNSYLTEKKSINAKYDDMKVKQKNKIKAGKMTDSDADKLLAAKWEADLKENALKKKYTAKFRQVLTGQQTWVCFDRLNDSKTKIRGEQEEPEEEE